ncbi:MAG: hypothetical protein ACKO96_37840, partial [Flammeovirgaceae bacterium]
MHSNLKHGGGSDNVIVLRRRQRNKSSKSIQLEILNQIVRKSSPILVIYVCVEYMLIYIERQR